MFAILTNYYDNYFDCDNIYRNYKEFIYNSSIHSFVRLYRDVGISVESFEYQNNVEPLEWISVDD